MFIVHMLQPGVSKTFGDYEQNVFGMSTLDNAQSVDIVFDVYKNDSLKQTTRERIGFGQRRQVYLQIRNPV